MTTNLKELTHQTSEHVEFSFNEDSRGAHVRVDVPGDIKDEFKGRKKKNMEFFRRLGELIAEADQEEHNEKYQDQKVEGSLFDAIKNRKEGQDAA